MNTAVEKKYVPLPIEAYMSQPNEEVINRLRHLSSVSDMCTYELSVRLMRVKNEAMWRFEGNCMVKESYPTFGEWVYFELGFSSRKAGYLVRIAERIVALNIPSNIIGELLVLGWSKAYHLLRARDIQELAQWRVECVGMAEREVISYVRLQIAVDLDEEGAPEELESPIRVKFSFSRKSQYDFYRRALALVEQRHGTKSTAEALSILGANFISTSFPGGSESVPVELDQKLKALEEQYGVQIAVIVPPEEVDKACGV